jgi:hypothetical protein
MNGAELARVTLHGAAFGSIQAASPSARETPEGFHRNISAAAHVGELIRIERNFGQREESRQ